MASHNQFGNLGERLACKHLAEKGYQIVSQNWRAKKFEIDIIAKLGNELHFVEVKSRSVLRKGSDDFLALNALNRQKLNHLITGVSYYVEANSVTGDVFLDLIAVDFFDDGEIEIKHYLNVNE